MIDKHVQRFIEVGESAIEAKDWETYGSVFAEDLYMETSMFPEPVTGREARVELVKGIVAAFPDGVVKVRRSFWDGEWACLEVLFTGTHSGPMAGMDGTEVAPTHVAIEWPYCMVMRFKDGLVSELYEYYDQLSLFKKLGLI